jgi:hypothetical protein
MWSGHDRQPGGEPPVAEPRIPLETEYLDLDHDGVPDAVQITEILEYDIRGGADVVVEKSASWTLASVPTACQQR